MRVVAQRVKKASVEVDGMCVGSIGKGILVLLGIAKGDTEREIEWMVEKVVNLRIFEKEDGRFEESLLDINGEALVVSQFTLYGDCSRGRRPSFSDAMASGDAKGIFEMFAERLRRRVDRVETGVFQAQMDVMLVNDGPVTIIIDSP